VSVRRASAGVGAVLVEVEAYGPLSRLVELHTADAESVDDHVMWYLQSSSPPTLPNIVGPYGHDSGYYRNALRGVVQAVLQMFCERNYVQEPALARAPASMSLRAQWV